jgi:Protein of unknown function (DUF4058)
MRSGLSGVNPYLENPELWSAPSGKSKVKSQKSKVRISQSDDCGDRLSRDYRVAVEKWVYLSESGESVLVVWLLRV